jgi:hypothetical protein
MRWLRQGNAQSVLMSARSCGKSRRESGIDRSNIPDALQISKCHSPASSGSSPYRRSSSIAAIASVWASSMSSAVVSG